MLSEDAADDVKTSFSTALCSIAKSSDHLNRECLMRQLKLES